MTAMHVLAFGWRDATHCFGFAMMFPKTVFWIGAKGGLVEQKHRRRMGEAVWLFLWLLLRQTDVSKDGEGVVFYGKPLSIRTITADTRFAIGTLHRWIQLLIEQEYIRTEKQPEGTVFWILKAKNKKKGVPQMEQKGALGVPQMERKCSINGTQKRNKCSRTQRLIENATTISSKGQNHNNKEAAANPAALSLSSLFREKQIPKTKLSEAELDARRRLLLDQAEELRKRVGVQ